MARQPMEYRLTISVPESLHSGLQLLVNEGMLSESAIVRLAIQSYLRANNVPTSRPVMHQAAE